MKHVYGALVGSNEELSVSARNDVAIHCNININNDHKSKVMTGRTVDEFSDYL